MPAYAITSQNFRDEVIKHSYPFDENSILEDSEISIGNDLLVDAVFYIKGPLSLPLRISKVDGTYGETEQVRITISDSGGNEAGTCVIGYTTEEALVVNSMGVDVGILAFNPDGVSRFIGSVLGRVVNVFSKLAVFLIDLCHVSRAPHLRYIVSNGSAVYGDVRIVARNGCRFVSGGDGSIRLDVLGVEPGSGVGLNPVRSINMVSNQSIWLENHPRSNLRISTENNAVKFTQAKDDK